MEAGLKQNSTEARNAVSGSSKILTESLLEWQQSEVLNQKKCDILHSKDRLKRNLSIFHTQESGQTIWWIIPSSNMIIIDNHISKRNCIITSKTQLNYGYNPSDVMTTTNNGNISFMTKLVTNDHKRSYYSNMYLAHSI